MMLHFSRRRLNERAVSAVCGRNREQSRLKLWFGSGAVIVALLGAGAALSPASGAAANRTNSLAPNNAVGWIATSTEFFPPASGAGPVRQDPAYPHVSNEEYRATGRQPTLQIADLSNPTLQP
jgi:hypothetical protein